MPEVDPAQLLPLQEKIASLTRQLEQAKVVVKQWSEASAQLSRNAAEARAKTQGMGRGLGGMILGSKYRASQRSQATRINASIAKQVADKRNQIAESKKKAQSVVQRIQMELTESKEQYRSLSALAKSQNKAKAVTAKGATDSVELLKKLKEAYDEGLLTEQEYEEKRRKFMSGI
jgi:putative oligomerization/nucleic acid binding protein